MRVKHLIKQLQKMNQEAKIVATGYYGATSDDIKVEEISDDQKEKYFLRASYKKKDSIVVIHTNICTG